MAETQAQYKTEADLITDEQYRQLLDKLRQVCAVGYGEVAIIVRDGHLSLMTVTVSERLSLAKEG